MSCLHVVGPAMDWNVVRIPDPCPKPDVSAVVFHVEMQT